MHALRTIRLFLLVTAIGCISISCNKHEASSDSGSRVVGFSQEGEESDWRTAESQSIKSEAQNRHIDLRFADAQEDQEKQIKAIRAFIAQRVNAIILAPRVETGWDQVLREAKSAKIPVVLVDRGVSAPEDLYVTLIASDFVEEGHRAADWLAKHTNGKAKIVELQGTAGSAPAIDRHKGFADELAKYPDMKILASQDGDFQVSKGKEVMAAFLKSVGKENITAVYAHNDNMALGALQAIQEAGLTPGKDIMVVSIDGIHAALQAILDGTLNCVVECNPLLGPQAFDAIDETLAGKTVPKRTVQKDELFDKSNLTPELLAKRKY